jgi:recombination protein RecA
MSAVRSLAALPAVMRRWVATPAVERAPTWSLTELAGRLVEISSHGASASLTAAMGLVLDAQQHAEPVAWVMTHHSAFYPPDAEQSGVDLDALVVVRVLDGVCAARAADELVRSRAFGLVVVDLVSVPAEIPAPLLTRLVGLAMGAETALVFLTEKPAHHVSLSSLVSLRAQAVRSRDGSGGWVCEAQVLKDKRRGPGRAHREVCDGALGMR